MCFSHCDPTMFQWTVCAIRTLLLKLKKKPVGYGRHESDNSIHFCKDNPYAFNSISQFVIILQKMFNRYFVKHQRRKHKIYGADEWQSSNESKVWIIWTHHNRVHGLLNTSSELLGEDGLVLCNIIFRMFPKLIMSIHLHDIQTFTCSSPKVDWSN